jgi:hypothetical protein
MGTRVMRIQRLACIAAAIALAGCSTSGMLEKMGMGGGSPAPASQQPVVQSNNPLAMPPDLQLKQPGAVADASDQTGVDAVEEPKTEKIARAEPVEPVPAPKGDTYEEYGISKLKPDGTAKSKGELDRELKAAVLKRKQQQNPNYGTFRNFGAIFSDG